MTEKFINNSPCKLLSIKAVAALTSLSVSHIRRESRSGNFPQPISISEGRIAWPDSDIYEWINEKLGAKS